MFDDTTLSDCNKLATHNSIDEQAPSVWPYDSWGSAICSPSFPDKTALQDALSDWCSDPTGTESEHGGPVSEWDVSQITDMSYLLWGVTCQSSFNANISSWDVSQVTNMEVRCRHMQCGSVACGFARLSANIVPLGTRLPCVHSSTQRRESWYVV